MKDKVGQPLELANSAPRHGPRPKRVRRYLLGLALLIGLAAVGCTQGAYPLDIFYEMHYQQTYKAQEPPSMSAHPDAVAWFPPPESSVATGEYLFNVNCSMCHGITGQGDGGVLQRMINAYGYTPAVSPDLTSEQVSALPDAAIDAFIMGGVQVMPSFAKLINPDERQAIIDHIRTLQQ